MREQIDQKPNKQVAELRIEYPYKAKIVAGNDYGLPIGKEFTFARIKEGNASPYPIELYSYGGNYRIYQMKQCEVSLSRGG